MGNNMDDNRLHNRCRMAIAVYNDNVEGYLEMTDKDFYTFAQIYIDGGACPDCPNEGMYEHRECPYEECAERIREVFAEYKKGR